MRELGGPTLRDVEDGGTLHLFRPVLRAEGFDWDDGNIGKNWNKHRVTDWEIEEVFFNSPIALGTDLVHSIHEPRFYALGRTNRGRWLFVGFTVRRRLIRPVTARDMNARERKLYETQKEDPDVQG